MNTDHELLVLAAKAAGLELADFQDGKGALWLARGHANPVTHSRDWSPLTDDGDALRLAAKLVMDFRCDAADREFRAACCAIGAMGHPCPGDEWEVYVPIEPCEIGTTIPYRRAAVALAAAIGKAMP